MNYIAIFTMFLLVTTPAWCSEPHIGSLDVNALHIEGAYCGFDDQQHRTVFASDWVSQAWMHIDGAMILFTSTKSDAERRRDPSGKRWRDSFRADSMRVDVDVVRGRIHNDTARYKGHITIRDGVTSTRLVVTGGCAA